MIVAAGRENPPPRRAHPVMRPGGPGNCDQPNGGNLDLCVVTQSVALIFIMSQQQPVIRHCPATTRGATPPPESWDRTAASGAIHNGRRFARRSWLRMQSSKRRRAPERREAPQRRHLAISMAKGSD